MVITRVTITSWSASSSSLTPGTDERAAALLAAAAASAVRFQSRTTARSESSSVGICHDTSEAKRTRLAVPGRAPALSEAAAGAGVPSRGSLPPEPLERRGCASGRADPTGSEKRAEACGSVRKRAEAEAAPRLGANHDAGRHGLRELGLDQVAEHLRRRRHELLGGAVVAQALRRALGVGLAGGLQPDHHALPVALHLRQRRRAAAGCTARAQAPAPLHGGGDVAVGPAAASHTQARPAAGRGADREERLVRTRSASDPRLIRTREASEARLIRMQGAPRK